MKTSAFEILADRGLVKHIGTSNMTIKKMKLLLRDAGIKPAANEMELHPPQQPELFDFVVQNGILRWDTLHSDRQAGPNVTGPSRIPSISMTPSSEALQTRTGLPPLPSALPGQYQRGQVPIPFSVQELSVEDSLNAASIQLTSDEMTAIAGINKCRLIKGQVFLWEDE